MEHLSRRTFLAHTIVVASAPLLPALDGASTKNRLILLGTGGGPRPRKARSASAQVIITNNTAYVIDCGSGVRGECLSDQLFMYMKRVRVVRSCRTRM
jgi:hypothetical protein